MLFPTRHPLPRKIDWLFVFMLTGFETPHYNLRSWLRSQGIGKTRPKQLDNLAHHVYVIGTQESKLNEKDWANNIKATLSDMLGHDMHEVC